MTFSFIVPVYNVEKYLAKCLDSLLAQTFPDFEIIVVNDGSPDHSQAIIDDYAARYPNQLKAFVKENGGLSDARNYGIARASGTYFVLVDSDDHIDPHTLERLNAAIENGNPDVIGFHIASVTETGKCLNVIRKPLFSNYNGEDAIIALVENKTMFEPAWSYAYRADYWKQNGFSFMKGIYHEDFALIPLVILRAGKVSTIDLEAYHYVCTDGSITRTPTPERIRRLAEDLLKGYDFLVNAYQQKPVQNPYAEKMYLAYLANSVIFRLESLEGETKSWFRKEVLRRNVAGNLISNTPKRKLRKLLIRLKNRI